MFSAPLFYPSACAVTCLAPWFSPTWGLMSPPRLHFLPVVIDLFPWLGLPTPLMLGHWRRHSGATEARFCDLPANPSGLRGREDDASSDLGDNVSLFFCPGIIRVSGVAANPRSGGRRITVPSLRLVDLGALTPSASVMAVACPGCCSSRWSSIGFV